jgi:hypothetical protein
MNPRIFDISFGAAASSNVDKLNGASAAQNDGIAFMISPRDSHAING